MVDRLNLSNFFIEQGYTGTLSNIPLHDIHVNSARLALSLDRDSFFLNGLISFAASINSINKNNYSWAFIQSYYSLFYLVKSFLANQDYAIHYSLTKPYVIKLTGGESFKTKNGNSHKVVLDLYKDIFSTDTMLSNDIEGQNPVEWFKKNREVINYRTNPLTDPTPPLQLYKYKNNIRNWLSKYLESNVYAFSEEHAYIAYIYRLINNEILVYENNNKTNNLLTTERIIFLKENIKDNAGPIHSIMNRLNDIKKRE